MMASSPEPKPKPKRRCLSVSSSASASASDGSVVLDRLLESALAMADPSIPIGLSLDRILEQEEEEEEKERILRRASRLGCALVEAATRCSRKLAAAHNSSVWPLNADLTVKVFSMVDTQSLCFAAATCSLFRRCASHSLCYAHIDLTGITSAPRATNPVVSTLIQRAANNLRSIKLGTLPPRRSPLTASCLSALTLHGGAAALLLQTLHLYNLKMKDYHLCSSLSACNSLRDLQIVGIDGWSQSIFTTIFEHCLLLERLCLDARGIWLCHVDDLTKNCPLLSSLALRGFGIKDATLSGLIKGACGLKCLDLSGSFLFSGSFLRNLGNNGGANSLDTLILRDCMNLKAKEVIHFLFTVLNGDWKDLRYVDISNKKGLVVSSGSSRPRTRCAIDVSQILQGQPGIHLIADYPPEIYLYENCMNSPPPLSDSDSKSSSSSDVSSFSLSDTTSSSDDEVSS